MQNQTQAPLRCSGCGQPINVPLRTYIDAAHDPEGKALLITGQLNSTQCPNCQAVTAVATPLLYHDPTKELLIALVPMELNLSTDQQEKMIGEMLKKMPKSDFRGYMFNPRRALTMQGLIEQVLEADGITPEMMKQQRERVRLARQFVEVETEEELVALVEEHDEFLDLRYLQTLTLMAQQALEEGQVDVAQHIGEVQNLITEVSSFGQKLKRQQQEQDRIIEEVADSLRHLGSNANREDFLTLAVLYAEDDFRLQALVGMARPVFDYEFFQTLGDKIESTNPDKRANLTTLRDRLLELTTAIDRQAQQAVQHATVFLQAVVNQSQPEQLIRANLHMIDDTFMAVLGANIQQAEKQKNTQAVSRLKEVYTLVINVLQENMQPELRFVNELLSADSDEEASAMLEEHATEFGDTLFEVFDAVERVLTAQGNKALVKRLKELRMETQQIMG